jgi:group I intron endonuclease
MARYIIYGLADPRTDEIRYIGKSSSGLLRPKKHLSAYYLKRERTLHKTRWIKTLLAVGVTPTIVVMKECIDEADLNQSEIRLIAEYRARGSHLTNITDGGCGALGMKHTKRTRSKIAKTLRKYTADPAVKREMSKRATGLRLSDEARANISKAVSGRKLNRSIKQQISDTLRNKFASDAEKQRLSDVQRQIWSSPESEARRVTNSRKHGGKPFTDQNGVRYETVADAARKLGMGEDGIRHALKGRTKRNHGYSFKYVEI